MENHDFRAGSRPSERRSCVGWFNSVEQQCLIPFECLAYVEAEGLGFDALNQ